MRTRPGSPTAGSVLKPSHGSTEAAETSTDLQVGDLVRWRGCYASVEDVAPIPGAGIYVTLAVDGRKLPLSVEHGDLAGATCWHQGETVGRGSVVV